MGQAGSFPFSRFDIVWHGFATSNRNVPRRYLAVHGCLFFGTERIRPTVAQVLPK
jgi:hypothetical protein